MVSGSPFEFIRGMSAGVPVIRFLLVVFSLILLLNCGVTGFAIDAPADGNEICEDPDLLPPSELGHLSRNCTPPTIQDFPNDFFTQEQRLQGGLTVHFILCIYVMLMIGIVVDEYFVPSLEVIATVLNMSPDVAGATIMAVGTSSPELFINLIGTFVTEGDIGVGMIVGSAAFNILAVPAAAGLFTGFAVALDWWPLTRDCVIYGSIVIGLAVVVSDGMIFWWEAMIFVLCYGIFLTVMFYNRNLERAAKYFVASVRDHCGCKTLVINRDDGLSAISDGRYTYSPEDVKGAKMREVTELVKEVPEIEVHDPSSPPATPEPNQEQEEDGPVQLFKLPDGTVAQKIYWYIMWLGNAIFVLTVPDVRRGKGWRRLYPLAFLICILWIGSLTYLVTWFITIIGYTLGIPDSAMGITFLAAGGSVPEAVAAVVVAKAGKGSMGISNSVGSNTFDILICMGLPWLIKSAAFPEYPEEGNFVAVNSGGVVYSILMLFCTVLILYFAIAFNKFSLDRKIGAVLLLSYCAFLVLAGMFELNVFMYVNAPPCEQ